MGLIDRGASPETGRSRTKVGALLAVIATVVSIWAPGALETDVAARILETLQVLGVGLGVIGARDAIGSVARRG